MAVHETKPVAKPGFSKKATPLQGAPEIVDSFAVTVQQEIGRVTLTEMGYENPVRLAFSIIAMHDCSDGPKTFVFTVPGLRRYTVTVEEEEV